MTVTVLSARETTVAGLIPTGRTVSTLRFLVAAGRDDVSRLAAPVPQRPGLLVLTVIGVYLIAMIVDFLVATIRRPTLAGLPLLALFMPPAAVLPRGVGTVPFLLGTAGFLLLLAMDGHGTVERWGQPITGAGERSWLLVPSATAGGLTVRVTLCAVAVTMAVPALLPSLTGVGPLAHRHGTTRSAAGPSSAIVLPPLVSLSQQLHAGQSTTLLSVRTATPRYLRLTALEQFDGQRFTLHSLHAASEARIRDGLPAPDRTARVTTVSAAIDVSPALAERYLPLPGIPSKITGLPSEGDWRLSADTNTVFSTRTTTAGAHFTVDASVPDPPANQPATAQRTVPASLKIDTELPPSTDPRIGQLAHDIVGAHTNAYQQAVSIQNYLRNTTFVYDLNGAPTTQNGALAEFLFKTRRGYCEQFASAMTVLLRTLGVPARVVIGFVPGTRQADGSYLITNRDAHSWPEAWFASTGWVPFEPTPRDDGTITPPYVSSPDLANQNTPSSVPTLSAATTAPSPGASPGTGVTGEGTPEATPADSDRTQPTGTPVSPIIFWVSRVLFGAGLVVALLVPAMVRAARRRRRFAAVTPDDSAAGGGPAAVDARVHTAWAELVDLTFDLGIPLCPNESPRAGALRLADHITASAEVCEPDAEAARAALSRIAGAEEVARYAPATLARSSAADRMIGHDLHLVARLLRVATPRVHRARAVVAPRSVVNGPGRSGRFV
jgi:transglutaminase-like putative cysteine protease